MQDDNGHEMPSDKVLRECARRENNFWQHAMPAWLELFKDNPTSPLLDGRVQEIKPINVMEDYGHLYPGVDEKPYILTRSLEVNYLVKDPKEPYRRPLTFEQIKGYHADPDSYPHTMPCIIRRPMRLNAVTIRLFLTRDRVMKTSFTHAMLTRNNWWSALHRVVTHEEMYYQRTNRI